MSINVRTRRPHPTSAPDVLIRPWLKSLAGVVGLLLSGLLFSCSDELSDAHAPALYVEDAGPSVTTADTTTYSPDSANNKPAAEIEEFRATESYLLWVNSTDWNYGWNYQTSTTYSAGEKYSFAIGQTPGCSGFMINSFDYVTAHHCSPNATFGTIIQPLFGLTTQDTTSLPRLRERLLMLGVGDAFIDDAAADLAGRWTCRYLSRPGSRDILVFMCDPKVIQISQSIQATLYPGDVWGHMDLTTSNPGSGEDVYALSVNRRVAAEELRTLLSPSGEVVTGNDACSETYYTSCVAQQGADWVPGSSGGAMLERDSDRVYGVIQGERYCNDLGTYTARDQNWLCNRNLISRVASGMEIIPGTSGTISAPSATSYSTLHGGTGGSLSYPSCNVNEALSGVVLSTYDDNYNSGATSIGLLGAVCSPVHSNLLRWDHLFVQSPGSYDTNFATTPASSDPGRVRLNRFVNTVDCSGEAPFTHIPVYDLQWEVCPNPFAVAAITGRHKYGKVMRIDTVTCRHTSNSSIPDLVVDVEAGDIETGATSFTTSCSSGSYANGLRLRVGWFLDAVSLRCRPR